MARILHIVLAELEHEYVTDKRVVDKYNLPAHILERNFGIFTSKRSADAFAQELSQQNPGIEVSVFSQEFCYFSKPTAPSKKKWDASSKTLVPV